MAFNSGRLSEFWSFARERHNIFLQRKANIPPPWTNWPEFKTNRFTNVFRELDRTTAWFRENVRKHYDNTPEVFLATIFFRTFNRISTAEILLGDSKGDFSTVRNMIGHRWIRGEVSAEELTEQFSRIQNSGQPVVTGAYTVMTPQGLSKAEGVAWYLNRYRESPWREFVAELEKQNGTAPRKETVDWLTKLPGQGSFISGQIVADLRFTYLHRNASDVLTWTPLGPGSRRGLHILADRPRMGRKLINMPRQPILLRELIDLLYISRNMKFWPNNEDYPPLELSDVQNLLCEYSKLFRIRYENSATRTRYDGVPRPVPGFNDYR